MRNSYEWNHVDQQLPEYGEIVLTLQDGYREVCVFRFCKGEPYSFETHAGQKIEVQHWRRFDFWDLPETHIAGQA